MGNDAKKAFPLSVEQPSCLPVFVSRCRSINTPVSGNVLHGFSDGKIIYSRFLSLGFRGWSSVCNFGFWVWAASNVGKKKQRFGKHCSSHLRGECVTGLVLEASYRLWAVCQKLCMHM